MTLAINAVLFGAFIVVAVCVGFIAGVIFHKTAIDKEERIMHHVSSEISALRTELLAEADSVRDKMKSVVAKTF